MGSPIVQGYGPNGSGPTPPPPPPPPAPPIAQPASVTLPSSFAELLGWFLLMFPYSWIQYALGPGTATTALFTAIVDSLGQTGDVVLPINDNLVSILQLQLRTTTATGNTLDQIALDFYGQALPRGQNESDDSYRLRIIQGIFTGRLTEGDVRALLTALTGFPQHIIVENARPSQTGAYTACTNIAGITVVGGVSYFPSFDNTPYTPTGPLPPCFWGYDVPAAPFRWVLPFTFDVLIETTYPTGWGAQGNAVWGYATITGSSPPNYTSPAYTDGSPSIFTNVSGGCFATCSGITVVDGVSYFGTVTPAVGTVGDFPTQTATGYFYSRGLTTEDQKVGANQVLTAADRLRAAGITYWMRCLPALLLAEDGWTS